MLTFLILKNAKIKVCKKCMSLHLTVPKSDRYNLRNRIKIQNLKSKTIIVIAMLGVCTLKELSLFKIEFFHLDV